MKIVFDVRELALRLSALSQSLATLSRLHLVSVLASADSSKKLQAAKHASVFADLAILLSDFVFRQYQQRLDIIRWPDHVNPENSRVIENGIVREDQLSKAILLLTAAIKKNVLRLRETISGDVCASPVEPLLLQIESLMPSTGLDPTSEQIEFQPLSEPTKPCKAITGPKFVLTDPVFEPAFSLLDQRIPRWTLADKVAVPHFWTVCIKETLGAELCALSGIEYDGMPLAFYRDMAKQAWDEMRHAVCYLEAAIELVPELISSLSLGDPMLPYLRAFQESGKGLPIPIERNLYEAMWNSSLVERLILFQVETEVPGSARKTKKLGTSHFNAYPSLALAIKYDLRDERSHTRIGQTWLKYLVPESTERRKAIRTTQLLRGVLILTSFVHHGGHELGALLDHYSDPRRSSGTSSPSTSLRDRPPIQN